MILMIVWRLLTLLAFCKWMHSNAAWIPRCILSSCRVYDECFVPYVCVALLFHIQLKAMGRVDFCIVTFLGGMLPSACAIFCPSSFVHLAMVERVTNTSNRFMICRWLACFNPRRETTTFAVYVKPLGNFEIYRGDNILVVCYRRMRWSFAIWYVC